MAHEIENMFSVKETPWHRLGTVLQAPPTTREAIIAAGLDWDVELRPMLTNGGASAVECAKAAVRTSDGRCLGVVGNGYHVLQNREAFSFFDPFLAAGEATLETAGSLREGSRIWVLAKLNRDPARIVGEDVVNKYILLANAHDGSLTVRVGFVPIRVVCANTLALAERSTSAKLVRVRHQRNVVASLDAIRDIMNTANASFEATAEQYRRLAATAIVEDDLKKYVKSVFSPRSEPSSAMVLATPQIFDGELIEEEKPGRVYPHVKRLFETGRGNQLKGVRGTLWAAYNAVTEYVAYERGTSDDVRVNHLWFGAGAKLNDRALQMAMGMATA